MAKDEKDDKEKTKCKIKSDSPKDSITAYVKRKQKENAKRNK
ncbi:hypothetical protein LCGC14_3019190 [marine sediment metagenome]|uniref:Uncharacterized protein n=1 Tax=marine sediment metagenome TaxID=412755 RepID=A0A0F8WWC9_9ZZZZ